jgi:hypothetical protein
MRVTLFIIGLFVLVIQHTAAIKNAAACTGGNNCCSWSNKCQEGMGDCDNDSECTDGLSCGVDNCGDFTQNNIPDVYDSFTGWDKTDDCCHTIVTCTNLEFPCASRQQCIPQSYVCDNENDCGDASDERNCQGAGSGVPSSLVSSNCEGSFTEFQKQACRKINEIRARHGVAPLRLEAELCRYAQNYADKLGRDNPETAPHSQGRYGENIFNKAAPEAYHISDLSGDEPVCDWFSEIDYYNFATGTTTNDYKQIGHFTQLVWANTKTFCIGAASATTRQSDNFIWTFMVASFEPPGNVDGQYTQNVKAPTSSSARRSDSC